MRQGSVVRSAGKRERNVGLSSARRREEVKEMFRLLKEASAKSVFLAVRLLVPHAKRL